MGETTTGPAGQPSAVFAELAQLVYAAESMADVHQALVDAAPLLVPGVDRASLMLRRNGQLTTVASTDEIARSIDAAELRLGEGPCLDAILDEAPQLEPDFAHSSSWPRLSEFLLSETPVRGGAGFRIVVEGDKVGALNLWSDTPQRLDDEAANHASVLAAFTSVAVSADHHRLQAATLRQGLHSNREIGKAIGLLMAFHKVDDDKAWEILRRTSSEMNMKVAAVAREIIDHQNRR